MKVLIQCGDHYENQKRILPLAIHLKNRGHEPYILIYSKNEGNIFKRLGIHVVHLGERKPKRKPVIGGIYKGIDLLSTSECDRLKQPWRFWPGRIKHYYSQLSSYVDSVLDIIHKVRPDFIFVWNGYTGFCANILREYCTAMNINHAYLERGLLKESLFIDTQGVNGFSSLSDVELNFNSSRVLEPTVPASPKTLFMPLQVQSDTNILYHSPHVKTMRHFVLVVADACQKLGHKLIVRQHPEEVENDLNLPFMDCIEYCNDGSIKDWVNKSDLTVTINSTVGLEAILEGKPVLSFGKSIYSNKQLDISVSPQNIMDVLGRESSFSRLEDRKIHSFHSILLAKHTCTGDNFPSVLCSSFPEEAVENIVDINLLNVPRRIINKARALKKINVFVDLTHKDKLNVTYRKNNEEITTDYIKSSLKRCFTNKINKGWITIRKDYPEVQDDKAINIILSQSKKHYSCDVIFDKYFNVIKCAKQPF